MECHDLTCGAGHKFKCPGGHKYGPFFIATNCKFNVHVQEFFSWCVLEDKKGKWCKHKIFLNNNRMCWKVTKNDQNYGLIEKLVREHIYSCGWNCNLRKMLSARKEASLKSMAQTQVVTMVSLDDVGYRHGNGDYLLNLADELMNDEMSYEEFSIE